MSKTYNRDSKPEVKDLSLELKNIVAEDWDDFILQLPKITMIHLSNARANCPGNIKRQKLNVYQQWRDIYPQATWNDVIVALEKAGLITEASNLEQKLIPARTLGNVISVMFWFHSYFIEPANGHSIMDRSTIDTTTTGMTL